MVETVEAGGNDVVKSINADKKINSVVQTSVEVTEPSLTRQLVRTSCNEDKFN